MRLLYGSQNFGYELANSDEDWLEFVYPTWKQLIDGNMTNLTNRLKFCLTNDYMSLVYF